MERPYSPGTVKSLSSRHGIQSSKSLGQNFLIDGNIVEKIVDGSLIGSEDLVIEVGPGFGAITCLAAEQAAMVAAVELDKRLAPALAETLAGKDNVRIFWQDILKTDLEDVVRTMEEAHGGPFKSLKIMGNLPYYITTPVIMKFLEELISWDHPFMLPVDSLTFMMQKEVADRIKAGPGTKAFGALSVAVQYRCETELIASVPKEVFLPQPKVDSAVLKLTVRKEPPVRMKSEKSFFAAVKAGFGQRRKTLANSLTGVMGLDKQAVTNALAEAGIEANRRAETLSLEEFARLSDALDEQKQ